MSNKKGSQSRRDNRGRVLQKGEGQRKDGRYYYEFKDSNGMRHTIYGVTLMELRDKIKVIDHDLFDGINPYAAATLPLDELFEKSLTVKGNVRENTRNHYKYLYYTYVSCRIGKMMIGKIHYSNIARLYQDLTKEDGLSFGTIRLIHTILYAAFQLAVRDDIIRKNPADGALNDHRKKFDSKVKERHALSMEDQRRFLTYTKTSPFFYRWYPLLAVMFGTGCRIGEVLALCWDDLDVENKVIHVTKTLTYYRDGSGHHTHHISLPKTKAGTRDIPMLELVLEAFKLEYTYQQEDGFNVDEVDGYYEFVFRGPDQGVLRGEVVNAAIKRIIKGFNEEEAESAKAEKRVPQYLPDFTCHHIRHTFCTRLCESETNIKVIQKILGHKDIQTTLDVYAEVSAQKQKEVIELLDKENKIF